MTHFTVFNCNYNIYLKNLYACMLTKFASNDFSKCVLAVYNVDKTVNLFSRAGMRNKWSSTISAVLDITIEDVLEKAIENCKAFRELAISSLNAQMKKRTG